jgi:hypothetical protein
VGSIPHHSYFLPTSIYTFVGIGVDGSEALFAFIPVDGRIQANAKHKAATREATPEEFHLADVLKELTGTVTVTVTIDNAKKKLEGMPRAKKPLNTLWGLLNEPGLQR